jgi:hypothetical protein
LHMTTYLKICKYLNFFLYENVFTLSLKTAECPAVNDSNLEKQKNPLECKATNIQIKAVIKIDFICVSFSTLV